MGDMDHGAPGLEKLFADRLFNERRKAGLTQDELGQRIDMERRQVARYEAGTHAPSVVNLRRICDALRVSPNFMLYGTEEPFKVESAYDRLAQGDSMERVIPKLAMTLTLVGIDDRRTLTDLIVRLAEAKHGEDVHELMRKFGVVIDQVADNPELKKAADKAADDNYELFSNEGTK